jgi:cytochrome c556
MSKRFVSIAAALVAVFGLIAVPALAQEEGAIKQRKSVMKAVGGHMGAMAGILKGQAKYPDGLKIHARAMADLAKVAAHIFPEGSDFVETQ